MDRAKEGCVGDRVDPDNRLRIQHRLEAIVQEMGEAMLRTSYSRSFNSSRDFSTALCDAEGRLVARPTHAHPRVGAIPWAVRSVQEYFGDRVRPGDVYLLNDPYHGNNHLPDLTAFVGLRGARLVFWSINRSHQSDIGGANPPRLRSGRDRDLGRKVSASRRCASTRREWCATTSSR